MAAYEKNLPRISRGCRKGFFIILCGSVMLVTLLWTNNYPLQVLFHAPRCEVESCRGKKFSGGESELRNATLFNTITNKEHLGDLGPGNVIPVSYPDRLYCKGKTCAGKESSRGKNELQKSTQSSTAMDLKRNRDLRQGNLIPAVDQSFQMWKDLSAPGKYRGCIIFLDSFEKKINMVPGGDNHQMTVQRCLYQCIKKKNTYAGLLGGTRCNCMNFTGPMDSLHYVPTSQCNVPCSGDPTYNCGGRNSTFSLYRTKVPDSRCSKISLKPKRSMPLIALASFPRSGNTWTRQLLQHATGIYTGSFYWKEERRKVGSKIFLGGKVPFYTGSTLCTKVHVYNAQKINMFHRGAILLLRNPYKAIVSEAFRSHKGVKGAGKKFIKSKGWTSFVKKRANRWLSTATNWCRNSNRLLVVNYEDLQKNTLEELKRMINFLKRPLDMTRITCAVQELPSSESTGVSLGSFGMRSKTYLTFDPFTKRMHKLLDGHIATVNATLIRYGHAPLPNYEKAPS